MKLKINENIFHKNCVFKDRYYNYFLINIPACLICYKIYKIYFILIDSLIDTE